MSYNEPIENIRTILEGNGIFPKAGTSKCVKMKEPNGSKCLTNCPHFKECQFFAAMCIDMVGCEIVPQRFPDGFAAHLMNSIDLFKAGIQVDFVEIDKNDLEQDEKIF